MTSDYLLTLHDERVSLPAVLALDLPEGRSKGYVVYSVLDAMLISASDALRGGRGEPRQPCRELGGRRRWNRAEGDAADAGCQARDDEALGRAEQAVFQRVGLDIGAVSGFGEPEEPYLDRLDEQIDRLLASIDAAANAMGMVLDLQLNERAYLVSVVATIFVPLTFITGFFGMNFGWMVDHVDTQLALAAGLRGPAATAALSWRSRAPLPQGDERYGSAKGTPERGSRRKKAPYHRPA